MPETKLPQIVRRERVYAGYVTVDCLLLRLAGGQEIWREVEHHGDAVAVLPYDPARRTALTVRMYRAPLLWAGESAPLDEACAGMIDPTDEGPVQAVRREALEELGVALGEVEAVGIVWTSPGVVAERSHLFLAAYAAADRVAKGGGLESEHEEIEVVETGLGELALRADSGEIADAKLFMLVQTLRLRRPDLFHA
jgi:nudix-type nucleoside diphosphatase (YffH/AdpP family)